MEKVITINYWWDGPKSGLAQYNGEICIYQRIFDEAMDDWSDEYFLIPVNEQEEALIMTEWEEWCSAANSGEFDSYYAAHSGKDRPIDSIIINSEGRKKYRKKAVFSGEFTSPGFIPLNYCVEWQDKY